jgi:hypothetical protein
MYIIHRSLSVFGDGLISLLSVESSEIARSIGSNIISVSHSLTRRQKIHQFLRNIFNSSVMRFLVNKIKLRIKFKRKNELNLLFESVIVNLQKCIRNLELVRL